MDSSAEALASAWLSTPPDRTRSERLVRDVVWRLLEEKRAGLAYHLARALGDAAPFPPWVARALVLGQAVSGPAGEVASALADDFAHFDDDLFEGRHPEWGVAVRFLLAGAAVRPAILAPASGAPAILRDLRFSHGLEQLFDYLKQIANSGDRLQALDPNALRAMRGQDVWRTELSRLLKEARTWSDQAPTRTTRFQATTNVWRAWVREGGLVQRLLAPLFASDTTEQQLSRVRAEAKRLSDFRTYQAEMHKTDRATRRSGKIDGPAERDLFRYLGEAVSLAQRWVALHAARPDLEGAAHLIKHVDDLREQYGPVRSELERFAVRSESPAVQFSAHVCLDALAGVPGIFDPTVPFPSGEPPLGRLLGRDLLHAVDVPLDADWQPELGGVTLVEALLRVVAVPSDWVDAFHGRTQRRDHDGTGRLLALLRDEPDLAPGVDVAVLEAERSADVSRCRSTLREEANRVGARVEEVVALGLLREEERLEHNASIEDVVLRLDATERFGDAERQLASIRDALVAKQREEAERVRQRLGALPNVRDQDRARVERQLQAGEVLAANEHVEALRKGDPITDRRAERDVMVEFFVEGRAKNITEQVQKSPPRDLVNAVRERKGFLGLSMSRLGDDRDRAAAAAGLLDAWFTLAQRQRATREELLTLLQGLALPARSVEAAEHSPDGQWWRVQADTLADRRRCPLPAFGSDAHGVYRLRCEWKRPTEEDVVTAVADAGPGPPVIVLYFGALTDARRRRFAQLCRERRRAFLLVDTTLVTFLCGEPGSRLPLLFECALPFTFVEPFTATAGIVAPEMFYGRQAAREDIVRPEGTCFIYGGRQLGKTTLLRDIDRSLHDPAQGRIVRWIDLKAERIGVDRPPRDLWPLLDRHLAEAGAIDHVPAAVGMDGFQKHVRTWLGQDAQRRILFLLDEADGYLEWDAREGRQTASGPVDGTGFEGVTRLKALMEATGRRFKVVFAGLHNVQRTTRDANNPLAHFGTARCIGPLLEGGEWRDARDLVELPLRMLGYRFDPQDLVTRILSQTNYYPSLIQLYCRQLLSHVSMQSFDSVPYTITAQHVDDAYRSQELRQAIRERFRWTLELDPRYEVVAYAMAYADLQGGRGMVEGATVKWIRDEAIGWWPEGFRGATGDEEIRTLCDEMVGLGVLRRAGADGLRYALRSPNVVLLLGGAEQIGLELCRDRRPPQPYEPATFRAALRRRDGTVDPERRSPLTSQQESELRRRENGVAIVAGCAAAGLADVEAALRASLGGDSVVHVSTGGDEGAFREALDAVIKARDQEATVLVLVGQGNGWTKDWVRDAEVRVRALTSTRRFVRVAFLADPVRLWALHAAPPVEGQEAWRRLSLRPWDDAALRVWLDDALQLHRDAALEARIRLVTGCWPRYLYGLVRGGTEGASLSEALDALSAAFPSTAAEDLVRAFGVVEPLARRVLHCLALLAPTGEEVDLVGDIVALSDATREEVEFVFHWATELCLVETRGHGHWKLDPVVARMLECLPSPVVG